ncbi:MAG: hypothetical protein ABI439_13510, partial [Rhodospirillales bacterium]
MTCCERSCFFIFLPYNFFVLVRLALCRDRIRNQRFLSRWYRTVNYLTLLSIDLSEIGRIMTGRSLCTCKVTSDEPLKTRSL